MKTKTSPHRLPGLRRTQGFSMIEVLMALIIITFGLLGVVGMQAVSISNTSTAGFRSIAALLAQNMSSAMSANVVYWQTKKTPLTTQVSVPDAATVTVTSSDTAISSTQALSSNITTCQTVACTQVAMAKYDVAVWGQALYKALPGGAGYITCTPLNDTVTPNIPASCQIKITWAEKAQSQNQTAGATATTTSYDYTMAIIP
jgi:type IV pilus assembly protein PilV